MQHLIGTVEKIVFTSPDTGFTVARIKEPGKKQLTTIVGSLPNLQPGEKIRCEGDYKVNPSYGVQFDVTSYTSELPTDAKSIERYLASGMIRGIGPELAKRIVTLFKEKALEILENNPDELLAIPGIGKKRLEMICDCWEEQRGVQEVMLFLQKVGITPAFAARIYKAYGDDCIERIEENPYALARDVRGIGFLKADAIAKEMGLTEECPSRIDAGILFCLDELASQGHVCAPTSFLIEKATELLGASESLVQERLPFLLDEERIAQEMIQEESFTWSKPLFLAEKGIGWEIERLLESKSKLRRISTEKASEWVENEMQIDLALKQKEAICHAVQEKFHIITGGPGTGKSTITKAILRITEKLTRRIALAAPTGRAAKRLAEITHRQASTIHSLLGYSSNGFIRNRENPLKCDLLIVDEASMIDTWLMFHLLRALPSETRVLLVGDIHQLPSVGPGNVLRDLIESGRVGVTRLVEIFRQARGSKIITNAHRINKGEFPSLNPDEKGDFFFIRAEDPAEVKAHILSLVTQRLPKRYSFDPFDDIQVLSPMRKGEIGIDALNLALQAKLNPQKDVVYQGSSRFGVGDKVMQIRNNYDKEIYNGDIGRILSIDRENQELLIAFDERQIPYPFKELDELVLAYATSVHKYQGSECPCILLPIHTSHFILLRRNLLYTAITRGKKLVILIGSPKAIGIAVSQDEVQNRYTGLQHALKELELTGY